MHGDVRAGDALRVEVAVLRNFGGAFLTKTRALVEGRCAPRRGSPLKPPR
jgi:hypothetical protein